MTSVRNETTYELFNMNRLPITTDPGGRALERPGVVALVPAAGAHAPRGDKNKSVRRRMIWNIRGDFGAEVIGSSGSGYAA